VVVEPWLDHEESNRGLFAVVVPCGDTKVEPEFVMAVTWYDGGELWLDHGMTTMVSLA